LQRGILAFYWIFLIGSRFTLSSERQLFWFVIVAAIISIFRASLGRTLKTRSLSPLFLRFSGSVFMLYMFLFLVLFQFLDFLYCVSSVAVMDDSFVGINVGLDDLRMSLRGSIRFSWLKSKCIEEEE
jgi:hypothetical protein